MVRISPALAAAPTDRPVRALAAPAAAVPIAANAAPVAMPTPFSTPPSFSNFPPSSVAGSEDGGVFVKLARDKLHFRAKNLKKTLLNVRESLLELLLALDAQLQTEIVSHAAPSSMQAVFVY
jgi:hypothetical protein